MANPEDTKQTILHMVYKYKDEASGEYVTAYFENTLQDMIIPDELQEEFFGATNMLEFTTSLMEKLNSFAPRSVIKRSSEIRPTEVFGNEQFIYEIDTRKAKIGDGNTQYQYLGYIATDLNNDLIQYVNENMILKSDKDKYFGVTTIREFMSKLMEALRTFNPITIRLRSYQIVPTTIYSAGQIVFESDTKKIKIGDGITQYQFLDYVNSASDEVEPVVIENMSLAEQILGTDLNINIIKEDGSSTSIPVPEADLRVYIKDSEGNYVLVTDTYSFSYVESVEIPIDSNTEILVDDDNLAMEMSDGTVDTGALELLTSAPTDGRAWYFEQTV